MIKIALFNHKGGVGKTTLTVNIADALGELGKRVLIVDADPQCNATAFYLPEDKLDEILGESGDDDTEGATVWSAVKPVVRGRGGVREIEVYEVGPNVLLAPGDVLLSDYEEELPAAWTDSFARKERGYDVSCALSDAVNALGEKYRIDVVLYDVGPNVGALNRVVLLDCDFFATPVAADLFSLRALTTVGRAIAKWVTDWKTVRSLANGSKRRLLKGTPAYLGYIASAFKVSSGRRKAHPHSFWENKIAPRVAKRVIDVLRTAGAGLVPAYSSNKLGDVKHFHSLAADAQKLGLAIGQLRGHVNSGHYPQVDEAKAEFMTLAKEIVKRTGI